MSAEILYNPPTLVAVMVAPLTLDSTTVPLNVGPSVAVTLYVPSAPERFAEVPLPPPQPTTAAPTATAIAVILKKLFVLIIAFSLTLFLRFTNNIFLLQLTPQTHQQLYNNRAFTTKNTSTTTLIMHTTFSYASISALNKRKCYNYETFLLILDSISLPALSMPHRSLPQDADFARHLSFLQPNHSLNYTGNTLRFQTPILQFFPQPLLIHLVLV